MKRTNLISAIFLLLLLSQFGCGGSEGTKEAQNINDVGTGDVNQNSDDNDPTTANNNVPGVNEKVELPKIPGIGVAKPSLSFQFLGEVPIDGPVDVACQADKTYFLANPGLTSGNAFFVTTGPGDHNASVFGQWGYGNNQFNSVSGIAVNKSGKIYAVSWGDKRLQVIDPVTWKVLAVTGYFSLPMDVAVDDAGLIYVSDLGLNGPTGQNTVIIVDPNSYQKIGTIGEFGRNQGIFIKFGYLFVADAGKNEIAVFDLATRSLVYELKNENLTIAGMNLRDSGLKAVAAVSLDDDGRIYWMSSSGDFGNAYYLNDITDTTPKRINQESGELYVRGVGAAVCNGYFYIAAGPQTPPEGALLYKINQTN